MVALDELKKEAKRLLEDGSVKYIIGYKRAADGFTSPRGDHQCLGRGAQDVAGLSRLARSDHRADTLQPPGAAADHPFLVLRRLEPRGRRHRTCSRLRPRPKLVKCAARVR